LPCSVPLPRAVAAPSRVGRRALAWAAVWAAGVSLLMSVQFLVQPWVWTHWPAADVLWAWSAIFRDRLFVALAITLAVLGASSVPLAKLRWRALLLAAAIAAAAVAAEVALRLFDWRPRVDLAGLAVRWVLIGLSTAAMYLLWRHSVEVQTRWQAEQFGQLLQRQQRDAAELATLKNQIEPHFLFNTLATVRRLQRTDAAAGATMLASFIDYLRRSLPLLDRPLVPLSQELDLLRAYLTVVQMRMSGRMGWTIDVPDVLQALPVPPLVVATLVENAVKHGLTPAADGGRIRIVARAEGARFEIAVEDTGVGFVGQGSGGTGIGLANARARLRTLYGPAAGLRLEAHSPHGVRAVMTLPAATGGRV
jgi:Histidine kinase/Histidine kinase-, DNA gyrase B-, and HSP90-like ATPase